jgi:hypothetical protein
MPSETPSRFPRRRVLIAGALAALVALVAVAVVVVLNRQGNVSNPNVEFRSEEPPPAPEPPSVPKGRTDPLASFVWPTYGYTQDRRRYLPARSLRPPFKRVWKHRIGVLLEFPPILVRQRLYVLADDGILHAIDKATGRQVWRRKLGDLSASSPAYDKGRLFVTILQRRGGGGGRIVALRARTGKILWNRNLPAGRQRPRLRRLGGRHRVRAARV